MFALTLLLSSCMFDDDNNGGVLPFEAAINAVDASTGSAQGILIFDYTVTGTPGTVVDVLAEYTTPSPVTDTGPSLPATQAPSGFGPAFASSPLTNIVLPASGAAVGRFCWYWSGDLGFVGIAGVVFTLTPVNAGTSQTGGPGITGALTYSGSASGNGGSVGSSGTGTGGRASHVAAFVGGTGPQGKVVVAGGNTPFGVTDTITRYHVDALRRRDDDRTYAAHGDVDRRQQGHHHRRYQRIGRSDELDRNLRSDHGQLHGVDVTCSVGVKA
jgi:hypothetical protein